ncbi:MAG: sulfatase-like hydrolase/transferase [Armatimonadetes bacterium]|nr:sulfatase-like hydrolase/transferase [Armatimonadota bacterium]
MNVILVSLDTTRADHLSCYRWPRLTSPHLDRLAEEGILFERCFSPWIPTHPAHTSLFTGQDPMRHQVIAQGGKAELAAEIPTLAELLRDRGYFTAAADNLGRWFSRGVALYRTYRWTHDPSGGWRKGEAVTEAALEVLNAAACQDRPFFLFLHYWDPHTPYLPPSPFDRLFYTGDDPDASRDHRGMAPVLNFPPFGGYFRDWMGDVTDIEFPKAQYDAEIAYMDACLQHVWTRLEELNLADRTLVVVTADHGEELDEHQMWFDHHGLYDTNLHIPLILRGPDIPRGARVELPVRLVDVAPTILSYLGFEGLPADLGLVGESLLPALAGGVDRGTGETLYLTECTWMRKRGLRTREWKLIVARDHPDIHGRPPVELYHLPTDPGEQRNLADERPDVVTRLKADLFAWVARRQRETGLPDPIEAQEITLRQIGGKTAPRPPDGKIAPSSSG